MVSFSFHLVNGVGVVFVGLDLSHGGSVEFDPVCVVNDAIEDGVGEGGFADDVVPLGQRQLEVDPNRWTAWRHLLGGIP